MELYIPEIGDTLILTKPWKFTLYAERRNQALASFFGYHVDERTGKLVQNDKVAPMRDPDYIVIYPDRDDPAYKNFFGNFLYKSYNKDSKQAELDCTEYAQYMKDLKEYVKNIKNIGKDKIEVEIPAGVELKIDRIYIRKGAKEYSSITFYANNLGIGYIKTGFFPEKTVKKKSLRFWAKLSDCNNIKFK